MGIYKEPFGSTEKFSIQYKCNYPVIKSTFKLLVNTKQKHL